MQFQSVAEEIKYLYKKIIFTYIKNQRLHYLEIGNNGAVNETNRIIIRCDKDEFIKAYIKELFPAPEIQSKVYSFSNWYLIEFGIRLNEGLRKQMHNMHYMTTSEVVELIYENPMKYFVEYNLCTICLWLPYGLNSFMGLTDLTIDQRKALDYIEPQWSWSSDIFTFPDGEMTIKSLRAYMKALEYMLSLETDAVRLGY